MKVPKKYRQKRIKINNKIYIVDGYNPKTNTIYEFLGDYWHGNIAVYNENDYNFNKKKTFGSLYKETMRRIKNIQKAGYKLIIMWENDWKNNGC